MRIRIIIDTEDADDPAVIEENAPFTLNVYRDDEDGTPSRQPLEIGVESALVGGNISWLLEELAHRWRTDSVLDRNDEPMPCTTGHQWGASGR